MFVGPETDKTVQIVIDGERCLRTQLAKHFPHAIFTLDLRHAQERLWKTGRRHDRIPCFHETFVFVHKHQPSQQLSQLVFDVVGEHANENV